MTFSAQSLSAFKPFQALRPNIQDILLKLVEEDRLNDYGSLKRPPNVWLIFRSDALASLDDRKINQCELTMECKAAWKKTTADQRVQLKARAEAKNAELLRLFPEYQYSPMTSEEKTRWSAMNTTMRKNFWLAAAVRIAEKIANPNGIWDGFLSLNSWTTSNTGSEGPLSTHFESQNTTEDDNSSIVPVVEISPGLNHHNPRSRARRAGRKDLPPMGVEPTPPGPFQPPLQPANTVLIVPPPLNSVYNHASAQPLIPRQSAERHSPPLWLKHIIVHLGPETKGRKRRRLVLSTIQPEESTILWVQEEVNDNVPPKVFELLSKQGPGNTSAKHIILHDYANPPIPVTKNEYGRAYVPKITSISDYHSYILAYHISESLQTPFVWPVQPTTFSPNTSPMSTPSLIMDDSPISDFSTLSPDLSRTPVDLSLDSDDEELDPPTRLMYESTQENVELMEEASHILG
ncbi:hypothetical protein FRC09_007413 [Ceratobasidium sp. 395]|nr:hypothetical protein FRC09_007413 [Ceratobasidium sp. 395]